MHRGHHQQGIAVRLGTGDKPGPDSPRSAGTVFDNDRLAQACSQRLGDQPGQNVRCSAWLRSNNDGNGALRPFGRLGKCRIGGKRRDHRQTSNFPGMAIFVF